MYNEIGKDGWRSRVYRLGLGIVCLGLGLLGNTAQSAILDLTYDPGSGASGTVKAIAVQTYPPKIVVGGSFSTFNGQARASIARTSLNGMLDDPLTFPASVNGPIHAMAIQNINGLSKIIIGGSFTLVNGQPRSFFARLDYDGTLDPSANATPNGYVNAIHVMSDNKILIGGDFTSVSGYTRMRVARLHYGGYLDTTFDPYYGANWPVYSVSSDYVSGLIFVGGAFTTFGGYPRAKIVRLLSNGSVDASFNASANNAVRSVFACRPAGDPRCAIGGSFTTVNNASQPYLAAVGNTGEFHFNVGSGANNTVNVVTAPTTDSDFYMGGTFTQANGDSQVETQNRITRINKHSGMVVAWNTGSGIEGTGTVSVEAIALQGDGKILVGGNFTTVDGTNRNNIARLNP